MKPANPIRRAMDRFAADPASVRNAALLMIILTVGIVLVGGMVVWVFDKRDFPDLGGALWYTLQTVTTVGYGDKVPTEGVGRLVGASVMIVAVALIAILTASITSTFVEAAQRRNRAGEEAAGTRISRGAPSTARRGGRPAGSHRGDAQITGAWPGRRDPTEAPYVAPRMIRPPRRPRRP